MNFQKIIHDLKARGWSQTQIAVEVDCSQCHISSICRGITKGPNYELAAGLIELLNSGRLPPTKPKPQTKVRGAKP